nr:hypothetical protein [Streptomyces sp. H51]
MGRTDHMDRTNGVDRTGVDRTGVDRTGGDEQEHEHVIEVTGLRRCGVAAVPDPQMPGATV